jgi:adenylyltransferase/sulfurtransferase
MRRDTARAENRGGHVREPGRYSRQTVLPFFGEAGQRRLSESTVFIAGCGALGSIQAELLARAGAGRIILADRDIVERHNLHRQFLFDEADAAAGKPKAAAAAARLRQINSEISAEALTVDITPLNSEKLFAEADIVLDGLDNYMTRYTVNDTCVKAGKPWVYGGALGADCAVMPVAPGRGPCLRCVFPEPPPTGDGMTCEAFGVLGTAVSVCASLQVSLAVRILLGAEFESFQMRSLNLWTGFHSALEVARRPDCPCCGKREFSFLDPAKIPERLVMCGKNAVQITPRAPFKPDFDSLAKRLEPSGEVRRNGFTLEFSAGELRAFIFPDGRLTVMGTTDPSAADAFAAKYFGN